MSDLNLHEFYLSDNQNRLISVIRHHVKAILVTPGAKKLSSLSWMFENHEVLGQISLKECCSALEISMSLIRIRMQYEIYSNQMSFVNLFYSQLPDVLIEEILVYHEINTLQIAKLIWCNPGISKDQLLKVCDLDLDIDLNIQLEKLSKFIALHGDKYYLPGRNVASNQNINWTKCWSFYD